MFKSSNCQIKILVLIPAVAIFVAVFAALTCYPFSEQMMEQLNFYVRTPELLSLRMSEYPGLTSLLTSWLLQFFKSPTFGFITEAGLLALMTLLAALVPVAWGRRAWTFVSLVPAVGFAVLFLHRPSVTIEGIFFYTAILAASFVVGRSRRWVVSVVLVLIGLLSFWFVAFPVAALLFAALVLIQLPRKAGWVNLVLPLFLLLLTVVAVKVSSATLGFIPFDRRWFFIPETNNQSLAVLLLLAAPLVLSLVPRVGKAIVNIAATIVVSVIAAIALYTHIADKEGYQVSEEIYHYAALAEEGEWQQLMSEINSNGNITNNLVLQYALLAEARLGTLTDNLFLYPINSPEIFCPRLEAKPPSCDFSRVFYRELGFYDEAFHQAFQYGMMASPSCGFCAGSLRRMAQYAVQLGDKPLAEKYLYLLDRTSNNAELVATLRNEVAESQSPKVAKSAVPLRAQNFVMAYPFVLEMAHFLDIDSSNKAIADYLLCSLLLTKQLEVFKTVLNDFADKYKDSPLPRAYAEAAAMIRHLQPAALSPDLHYDSELDKQFEQFTQLHNSKQDDSAFRGTFWYYYVYAQIPPQQEWISQSQSS